MPGETGEVVTGQTIESGGGVETENPPDSGVATGQDTNTQPPEQ